MASRGGSPYRELAAETRFQVQLDPSSRADLLGNRIFETCLQFPGQTRFRNWKVLRIRSLVGPERKGAAGGDGMEWLAYRVWEVVWRGCFLAQ